MTGYNKTSDETQATKHFQAAMIGLVAGFGGGLMSLGGGTLIVPLLTGWAKLSQLDARGTALLVSIISAFTGTIVYALDAQVNWWVVLWTGSAALVTAPVAVHVSRHWSTGVLRSAFGIVASMGGILLIIKGMLLSHGFVPAPLVTPFLICVGVLTGAVAGVVGISGGPVLAPLFVFGLGMPQQLAQGCSLAARLPSSISGSMQNFRHNNIRLRMLPGLAVGAVGGAVVGSKLALLLPEDTLRTLFGVLLIILGVFYSWSGWRR